MEFLRSVRPITSSSLVYEEGHADMVFLFFLGASGLDPGAKVEGRIGSLSGRFKNTGIDWKGGEK